MKFSIIIPVYNAENKLSRCLDSIIHQDYDDYELVLVNDGSTDNSAGICKKYCENYDFIKYIEKDNGGASSARNAGLDKSNGDFILFVDSDDYVEENYFSSLDNKAVKDGLAVFTYRLLTNKNNYIRPVPNDCLNNSSDYFTVTKSLILSRTINSPCAKIFDKALIDKSDLRFDENMPVAEDFNFCLAYIMKCNDIKVYNESVYCYDNTNESSLVNKRKEGLIDIYPYVFDTAFSTINNSRFNEQEKAQLFIIWDKLHTDSFITCVIEEVKADYKISSKIKNIRAFCKKFNSKYSKIYGYVNIVHFGVRMCIKLRFALTLYVMSYIYFSRK